MIESCRRKHIRIIEEDITANGQMSMDGLAKLILKRSVRYVHSLVKDSTKLAILQDDEESGNVKTLVVVEKQYGLEPNP